MADAFLNYIDGKWVPATGGRHTSTPTRPGPVR